jgi:hypothetical protein
VNGRKRRACFLQYELELRDADHLDCEVWGVGVVDTRARDLLVKVQSRPTSVSTTSSTTPNAHILPALHPQRLSPMISCNPKYKISTGLTGREPLKPLPRMLRPPSTIRLSTDHSLLRLAFLSTLRGIK